MSIAVKTTEKDKIPKPPRAYPPCEILITKEQGEVPVEVYRCHDIECTTGVESGWSFPNGAKRKLKMAGMVPIVQSLPIRTPTKIWLFPESGEYQMNGTIYAQSIN